MADSLINTVLVTGASSGIGRVTCLHLAEKGYTVVGTSRSLEEAGGSVRGRGGARAADVGRGVGRELGQVGGVGDAWTDRAVRRVRRAGEQRGVRGVGAHREPSIEELKLQFEANFFGAVRMIHATLPGMLERRSGRIVNISSVLGRIGTPFNGAYVSSKYALEGLSESLRTEVAPFGVKVALVEPGLFDTNFQKNQLRAARSDDPSLAYAPYVESYNRRHDQFDWFAADPIKVARVIEKVIRSRNPSLRHPVGLDCRLATVGARILPERLFHALLSRATMR